MCETGYRFKFVIVVPRNERLGPRNLFPGNTALFYVFDLSKNCRLSFSGLRGFEIHFKKTEIRKCHQVCGVARDQFFLIADIMIEHRSAAFTQYRCENLERSSVVGKNTRAMKTQRDVVLLNRSSLPAITHRLLVRLNGTRVTLKWFIASRRAAVQFHDFSESVLDVDFSGDGHDDVRGLVILLHISRHVVAGQATQSVGRADSPTFHAVLVEGSLIEFLGSHS